MPRVLSAAFLEALDVKARQAMWRRALGSPDRVRLGRAVHVATVDGVVVGFSATRPSDDGPRPLQLVVLYLLAAHHGSGLGQRLLDAAVGSEPAFLWVAEANPRAQAFYSRNGFVLDGARAVEPDWENLAEVRMIR